MKIVITGATGFIGKKLCSELIKKNHQLIIFSRDKQLAEEIIPQAFDCVEWDYKNIAGWKNSLDGSDAVIHLAGANISGKIWNENYKQKIYDSRIISTKNLVKAVEELEVKPKCFICSSAVGYYGNRGNDILKEDAPRGDDFLANLCKNWENESQKIEHYNVRRISVRTGIVLSTAEGALKRMLLPFKLFAGGPLGNGKQWFPWIHVDDLINTYVFALENSNINGPVNAVSPNPVIMKDFAKSLGKILHRPSLFPVPLFALKIAVGEIAESITASQRVIPQVLIDNGFKFEFGKLETALKDLLLQNK